MAVKSCRGGTYGTLREQSCRQRPGLERISAEWISGCLFSKARSVDVLIQSKMCFKWKYKGSLGSLDITTVA